MNHFHQIHLLYKPIQPTIRRSASGVSYMEYAPAPHLTEVIFCYWQLKTKTPLASDFRHVVVSDGCVDIYFELANPDRSYVMGYCDTANEFALGRSFDYIGIRFLPTMFPQLFGIDAGVVRNRFESLRDVLPETAKFLESSFDERLSVGTIFHALDAYLTKVLVRSNFDYDNRLYGALHVILQNAGLIAPGKDLDTGVSARQLRRMFNYYIGDTAKSFSNVVRFQNILKANPTPASLKRDKPFFDFGYYDQSHFIKEFKKYYGSTPHQAFAS